MTSMNFVTFNQDYSLLGIGTSQGFRLYYTDPFSKCFETHEGDISMLEMLFSTSLVALILSPRLLRIQNTKRRLTICELTFPTTVLAVRLNQKRLVVVLEDAIYIYDISNMKLLDARETSPNPTAICALSPSSDNNYLVYPLPHRAGPSTGAAPAHTPPMGSHIAPTSGAVMLFDASKLEAANVIEAHQTPLSCVAMNRDGKLLVTASEKGTVIRVFSIPAAGKLFQFRRGSMPSRIYSMAFNASSDLLCVSSASDTVHIFRLSTEASAEASTQPAPPSSLGRAFFSARERSASPSSIDASETAMRDDESTADKKAAAAANASLASVIRRTSQHVGKSFAATVGGYLPSSVTGMWEPARDFAWVRIPKPAKGPSSSALKSVVAMSANGPHVMVVTSDGNYFVYSIDLDKGGEGWLLHQYSSDRLAQSTVEE